MKFWESFNKFVGVQGVLALGVTGTMLVMSYQQIPIPEQLWTLLGASWGFYFAKNGGAIVSNFRSK